MKKTTLLKLFNRKDCLGWAWQVNDKKGYYTWHNCNDLGLLCDIDECTYEETVLKKIKMGKRKYIYILRNKWGLDTSCDDAVTIPQLKAYIRDCYHHIFGELSKHDAMLIKRAEAI